MTSDHGLGLGLGLGLGRPSPSPEPQPKPEPRVPALCEEFRNTRAIYPGEPLSRMRQLAHREYAPALAYAAAGLFLIQILLSPIGASAYVGAGLAIVFAAVIALLVLSVDSPSWAPPAGLAWAGLLVVGGILLIVVTAMGATAVFATMLATFALFAGAIWVAGASFSDPGAGRALGIAAAAGMIASGVLRLVDVVLLVESPLIVRLISTLTLALLIGWFVVLARDLEAGKRHYGDAHRVVG